MGIVHASTMVHIAFIWIYLNCLFPAMDRMVWYAASTLPLTSWMWVSKLAFSLSVSPRYLYLFVYSRVISPSLMVGIFFEGPIFRILLFLFQIQCGSGLLFRWLWSACPVVHWGPLISVVHRPSIVGYL